MTLQATKASIWKNRYDISQDGRAVARWQASTWKTGGSLELDGQRYTVSGNMWGSTYGMAREDGTPVATANHVGRKRWTVESEGRSYELQRASWWSQEQQLCSGGQPRGSIKRTSMWRSDATAELPDLPLPVQVFILVVALSMWDSSAAASAGGAAAAGGAVAASG